MQMSKVKKDKNRTERRIDYTKHEIAREVGVSDNTIDYKLEKMCEFYGIKADLFKRYGEGGRNFYPADYGELLILLLKAYDKNPATKKKTTDVTAEDVAVFNSEMRKGISENKNLPNYLRECMESMPWYREAGDISDWTELLVEEFTQFIINLTSSYGGDIGQSLKFICRELDYMNYHLYRGSYFRENIQQDNDRLQREMHEELFNELYSMDKEDREKKFHDNAEFLYFYNAYLETNGEVPVVNRNDISIDRGILSVMQALMAGIGLSNIQQREMDRLPEFLNDEEYAKFVKIMDDGSAVGNEQELIDCEREWYLNNQEESVQSYIEMFLKQSGKADMVVQGKKWESIPEKIKKNVFFEDYKEGYQKEKNKFLSEQQYIDIILKLPKEEQSSLFKKYLLYYEKNKEDNKRLREIVSRFVGQVLLNYLSDSKK